MLVPLFDLVVDFKVFVGKITRLLMSWLQKMVVVNSKKKGATNNTTFQNMGKNDNLIQPLKNGTLEGSHQIVNYVHVLDDISIVNQI